MNKREQMLAAGILALVALWAGYHFYGNYAKTVHARQTELEAAETKLDEANHKLKEGHEAVRQIEAWQQRALPANFDKAQSLYKAWLLAKAKDSGLVVTDIILMPTTSSTTAYKAVGYQMAASGSLSSVVAMLYEIYHSPQLHQISSLRLSRAPGSPQLTVALDIEALSMRGAVATDKLPEGESKRLKLASADAYKKSLAERDLVAVYTPPRPPTPVREHHEPKGPPKYDDANLAYFSGAVSSGNGWQAWINVRSTGETLRVVAGDPVKVGALEGKIVSVEPRALVYSTGEKKFRVALGDSLRKGKEIGGKGAAKKEVLPEEPKG